MIHNESNFVSNITKYKPNCYLFGVYYSFCNTYDLQKLVDNFFYYEDILTDRKTTLNIYLLNQ